MHPASDARSAPPRYAFSHELFGRAMGLVCLLAWLSLHVQLETLFGPRGLVPMELRIEALLERDGAGAILETPSLLHLLGGSLPSMQALTFTGELASLAMIFGILPGPAALLSFFLYLSFVSVGWPFLPLQWDTLLLESLILAALLGRWRAPRPSRAVMREPSMLARVTGFTLVARLFFASGLVKLLSGDPTWRDGTAMAFHHWTQPLPSPLAPLFFGLPSWFHAIETHAVLVLEIGAPLLLLWGLRGRRALAAVISGLMVLIALSGSYGFFNLLTVVLCIPLLDDEALRRLVVARLFSEVRREPEAAKRLHPYFLGAYLVWATTQLITSLGAPIPAALEPAYVAANRFHVAGHYGLFAVMTTDRHELLLEGSEDGTEFGPYGFFEKPGDPSRGPRWSAPHMPRFDWMLWFAALGPPDEDPDPWIARLARGLLEDRPETRALFSSVPFEGPPRAVRLVRARYRFADEGSEPWQVDDRVIVRTWRRRAAD